MAAEMEKLGHLADSVGLEREYLSLDGGTRHADERAQRAILTAMGIPAGTDQDVEESLGSVQPIELGNMHAPADTSCFMPAWLKDGRCWGVTCQIYSLRSDRNWGIGDFEDLARYAEIVAASGAEFVGVNPLHALFLAAPERCSPFSPSHRQFLNPLYIAVDRVAGGESAAHLKPGSDIRDTELVDYRGVAAAKREAFAILFDLFRSRGDKSEADAFEGFRRDGGEPLADHALFEALSEAMSDQGYGVGWHGWPDEYKDKRSDHVRAFAEENADRVTFHAWLQWIADLQLADAQARARKAGMRIGLYLDLAVGVTADGSATWSDPELAVPAARIGAPPDYFNAAGQDWGLAPMSPSALVARRLEPYREAMGRVLRHAGALRIDHAMSLYRLFWIANELTAADGVYVRYPFPDMLRTLAEVSNEEHALVIGEDLGVVPPGFREVMRQMEIQSYRVFFFEKKDEVFHPPDAYPREALACITTHDLYTLAGWWTGRDLEVRREVGWANAEETNRQEEERAHERRRVLALLSDHGLLPPELHGLMHAEVEVPPYVPESFAVALHRLLARTPSRLFAVPAEDLTGATEQVNLPGTTDEHPNWRRKLSVPLEELPAVPLFSAITRALREERPRAS